MSETIVRLRIAQRLGLRNLPPEAQEELRDAMEICDGYCNMLRKILAIAEFSISATLDQIEAMAAPEQPGAVGLFSAKTKENILPILRGAVKELRDV